MTSFDKQVTRLTVGSYRVLYASASKAHQIVVTLKRSGNEDLIEFRAKGHRMRWLLPADAAFRTAVRNKALAERAEKPKKTLTRKKR